MYYVYVLLELCIILYIKIGHKKTIINMSEHQQNWLQDYQWF